jgi:hypothetical protein
MFAFGRGALSVIYRLGALPAVRAPELADVFGLQAGRKFACCQSLVHAVAAGSVLPLWHVVDFCANRFVLRFRSSNKGATPWLRKQRRRKRRRRSNFALRRQWASQLRARRMSSAAGHFQPPFACAIGILNGVAGWFRAHSPRAAGRTLAKTAIPAKPSKRKPRLIPVLSVAQIPTPDFPAKRGSRAIAAPCMESTD